MQTTLVVQEEEAISEVAQTTLVVSETAFLAPLKTWDRILVVVETTLAVLGETLEVLETALKAQEVLEVPAGEFKKSE